MHDVDDHRPPDVVDISGVADVVGIGAPAFVLDLTVGADGVTVAISGDLDLWGGAQLEQALDELDPSHESVTVDLSEVAFLDSLGVRALVLAWRSGRVAGFVNPSDMVARVLDASGLTELLITPTSA